MIIKFGIFEAKYNYDYKVGDYVYVNANDYVNYGPADTPVFGDAGEIMEIEPTNDPDIPGGYTATVKLLSQDNKIVTLSDYEIIELLTKDIVERMKYKFNINDIVKWKDLESIFYFILRRKFEKSNLLDYYYLKDPFKDSLLGWAKGEDLRNLTPEEQEEYDMLMTGKKFNL